MTEGVVIKPSANRDTNANRDFEPHHNLMEDVFWSALATRIPAMEQLRQKRAWAGHYEVNTLDQNIIIRPHDEIGKPIFCTGYAGRGVMHAPGYARIRSGQPLAESIVY